MNKLNNYEKISSENLQKYRKKTIGEGTYSYVYPINKYLVVKFYKTEPKNNIEAEIHEILQKILTLRNKTPIIPLLFQWDNKYLVLERLDNNFHNYSIELLAKTSLQQNKIYKSIILQVLLGLGMLQKTFPGFRHNDLKLNNILVKKDHDGFTQSYNKKIYKINKSSPLIKISDFDYTNIPKKIINPKVGDYFSKTFGCSQENSNIYDMHMFLNSLYKKKNVPNSIIKWIESIIPSSLLGEDNENIKHGRLIKPGDYNRKITSIKKILEEKFNNFIVVSKSKNHYGS